MTNTMAKKTLEDLCCDKILLELYPFMDFLVAADPILSAVPVNLEEDDGHGPVLEEASQEPANILDVVSTQEPSEKGKLNTEDAAVEPPSRPLSELSSNFDILEGFSEESSISESLAEPVNYIEQDNLREAYRIPTEQDHLKAKLEEPKQSIITSHARKRKQNNTTHEIFIGSPGAAETIKPSQNKRRKLELISSPKRSQTKTQRQNADSGVRDTNWKNNTIAVFEASSRIISKILNNLQPDNFVNEDENLKLLAAKHLSILEKLEKWEPNQRAQRQTYQKGENRNNVAQNKRRGYIDRMIKRQKDTDNGIDDYKETCRADYETSNDAGKAFIDRILDEIGEYKPFVPKPRHNPTAYRAPDANELHNLRELLFGDNPPKHHDQFQMLTVMVIAATEHYQCCYQERRTIILPFEILLMLLFVIVTGDCRNLITIFMVLRSQKKQLGR
uniref:OTU domain-containing protein n=1 Tax=Panagrellus redivivus TaxID=6233 RepID=A0A7E5A0W3_PANRE